MASQITEESIRYSFASEIDAANLPSLAALISAQSLASVHKLTSVFPANISSFWGYEVPLSKSNYSCDFLCCITDATSFRRMFENQVFQSELMHEQQYARLYQFSKSWADKKNILSRSVNNIWLEYDCKDLFGPSPVANFFYGPRSVDNKLEFLFICNEVFSLVADTRVSGTTYRFLLGCLQELEGKGYLSQVGTMMARNNTHLRLFIQGLQNNDIVNYLASRKYKSAGDPLLQTLLDQCNNYGARVDLDIDILDSIGDNIGLECYFKDTVSVLKFLDFLQVSGFCNKEKQLGLKEHLQNIQYRTETAYQHFFSHMKLLYSPSSGISAKAYLGFAHNDVARNIIKTKPLNSYS